MVRWMGASVADWTPRSQNEQVKRDHDCDHEHEKDHDHRLDHKHDQELQELVRSSALYISHTTTASGAQAPYLSLPETTTTSRLQ